MDFPTPDFVAVRAAILRDIQAQRQDAVLSSDSDEYVRAAATGTAIEGLYSHQIWVLRQLFPQTANSYYLRMHCQLRAGMTPKRATIASGTISFLGNPGQTAGSGVELALSGTKWITTASVTIGDDGTGTAPAQAEAAGAAGNLDPDTVLTMTAAPPTFTSAMVVTMGGGTDDETDSELLARLLYTLQNPPGAGKPSDYVQWATSVNGVSKAYPYPRRRGLGTVDVCITSAGGAPSDDLIAQAQTYIDEVGPADADKRVFGPTLTPVNVTVKIKYTGTTLSDGQAAASAMITTYFSGLAPGDSLVLNQLGSQLLTIPGIVDYAFVAPAANVAPTVDVMEVDWLRTGAVVVEPML